MIPIKISTLWRCLKLIRAIISALITAKTEAPKNIGNPKYIAIPIPPYELWAIPPAKKVILLTKIKEPIIPVIMLTKIAAINAF